MSIDLKISQLDPNLTPALTDVVAVVIGGVTYKVQIGNLGIGGGSQTPWTETIDADNFALLNFLYLESNAVNVADTGEIRLGNNEIIAWRNNAGTGNKTFKVDSADKFLFSGGLRASWFENGGTLPTGLTSAIRLDFDKDIAWRNQNNTQDYHLDISPGAGSRIRYGTPGGPANIVTSSSSDTLSNKKIGTHLDFDRVSIPADPAADDARLYLKQIDANNDGLFIKIKKGGVIVEVQVA
jgi:hypothetical protein